MAGIASGGMVGVKMEGAHTPSVKYEFDDMELSEDGGDREGMFEDEQGDLDMNNYATDLFLARLPKYLWKSWETLGDDEEIEIGTLRVEGDQTKPSSISLRLHPTIPTHKDVPKEFVLQVTNEKPPNTYVFSEEDLPGFSSKLKMSGKAGDATNLPMSKAVPMGMRSSAPKPDPNKVNKTTRFRSFRRAIPKKTGLAGRVRTELNCLPVENEEYQRIMLLRNAQDAKISGPSLKSREGSLASLLGGGHRTTIDNFIKTAPVKPKTQQNKAVRMAQNEILDALAGCFRRYKYWRLKDLRQELQQPEQYIKSTLTTIGAKMVSTGSKVGTYALTEGASKVLHMSREDFVGADEGTADIGGDGDEDVKMGDAA